MANKSKWNSELLLILKLWLFKEIKTANKVGEKLFFIEKYQ